MSKHAFVDLAYGAPTLISESGADVSAINVQNTGDYPVRIIAAISEAAQAESAPGYDLQPGQAILAEDCPKLFQGIAPVRWYGFAYGGSSGQVMVDHA